MLEARRAQPDARRWFKRFGRTGRSRIRLFCLHHAGGAASLYRAWPRLLPEDIEPVAVQLPGRADRFSEPAYDRMEPLVAELVDAIGPLLDQPFACYGTSMGARVAWALSHALRERALPMPQVLYVASNPAPRSGNGAWDLNWPDERLVRYLRDLGSTPPEALDDPDLLAVLMPTLRADLTLLTRYTARSASPLDVPIHAFAATGDTEASAARMRAWAAETSAAFALDLVPGGHLFDPAGVRQVIRTITDDLS
jgi:surfactin synthase thioesterase subunit